MLLYNVHTPFAYVLEKFGDNPCSSLMVLCTRGVQTGGDETLMPPLGRVESSEEVLTRIWTVSIGGILPRFTTNTVLSKSSSISMCPETSRKKTKNAVGVSLSPLFTPIYTKQLSKLMITFLTEWCRHISQLFPYYPLKWLILGQDSSKLYFLKALKFALSNVCQH